MDLIFYLIIAGIVMGLLILKTEMEYNPKHKDRTTDYLPWVIPLEDGTILNKNGSITRIYKYVCDDMDHNTDLELFLYRNRLNDILRRLDEKWVIQIDSIRTKAKKYPNSNFEEKILQELDESRKQNFTNGKYYESDNYLTLTFFPPKDQENTIKSFFIISNQENPINNILEKYEIEINEIVELLASNFISIKQLNNDEIVSFLYECITGNKRNIKYIKGQYLDSYVSDVDIKNDMLPIEIGKKYLKVISILSYIDQNECGLFDEISRLGIEYRWNNRFIYISNENAMKISKDYQKAYFHGRKDMAQIYANNEGVETAVGESGYARKMQEQAKELEEETRSGYLKAGYYNFNIILMEDDEKKLKDSANEVMKVINNLGFIAVDETVNCLESYFSTMPGNVEHGLRKPILTTANLISFIPVNMDWNGNIVNKHLKKEALLFCESGESSSFYLNLHRGDVGHTAVLGQTGGGKSVLLNTLAYQSRKYGSRVIIFDKGGSARVLTRAVGGKYNNIGKDNINFQPLRYIEKESEREWALEWILMILRNENLEITPQLKNKIVEGLGNIANMPVQERTITILMGLVQDDNFKNVIKAYTKDESEGIYGRYFDNNQDDIKNDNMWQTFEMENVFDSKMLIPILTYLFHRIETELFPNEDTPIEDTVPTYLFLDECWAVLDDPFFAKTLKSWLKTLRKKNVSVVLLTQSLSDVDKSAIRDTIYESCLTKIFLANPEAQPSTQQAIPYYNLGLNEREVALISQEAQAKKDYFIVGDGAKLIQLGLTKLELAYVGSSDPKDQAMCEEIWKEAKGDIDYFNKKWRAYKNV